MFEEEARKIPMSEINALLTMDLTDESLDNITELGMDEMTEEEVRRSIYSALDDIRDDIEPKNVEVYKTDGSKAFPYFSIGLKSPVIDIGAVSIDKETGLASHVVNPAFNGAYAKAMEEQEELKAAVKNKELDMTPGELEDTLSAGNGISIEEAEEMEDEVTKAETAATVKKISDIIKKKSLSIDEVVAQAAAMKSEQKPEEPPAEIPEEKPEKPKTAREKYNEMMEKNTNIDAMIEKLDAEIAEYGKKIDEIIDDSIGLVKSLGDGREADGLASLSDIAMYKEKAMKDAAIRDALAEHKIGQLELDRAEAAAIKEEKGPTKAESMAAMLKENAASALTHIRDFLHKTKCNVKTAYAKTLIDRDVSNFEKADLQVAFDYQKVKALEYANDRKLLNKLEREQEKFIQKTNRKVELSAARENVRLARSGKELIDMQALEFSPKDKAYVHELDTQIEACRARMADEKQKYMDMSRETREKYKGYIDRYREQGLDPSKALAALTKHNPAMSREMAIDEGRGTDRIRTESELRKERQDMRATYGTRNADKVQKARMKEEKRLQKIDKKAHRGKSNDDMSL